MTSQLDADVDALVTRYGSPERALGIIRQDLRAIRPYTDAALSLIERRLVARLMAIQGAAEVLS